MLTVSMNADFSNLNARYGSISTIQSGLRGVYAFAQKRSALSFRIDSRPLAPASRQHRNADAVGHHAFQSIAESDGAAAIASHPACS